MTRQAIGTAPIPSIAAPAPAGMQAHHVHNDPDAPLVLRAQAGDKQAMAELFVRHRRSLINICCRIAGDEGEDAVMEVIARFPSRITTFDPQRGVFAAWFRTVARNEALKLARKRARQNPAGSGHQGGVDHPGLADDPQDRISDADLLVRFLASLPVRQRDILTSSAFLGEPDDAIADRLGVSTVTVRTTRVKARTKLRQMLTDAERAGARGPS